MCLVQDHREGGFMVEGSAEQFRSFENLMLLFPLLNTDHIYTQWQKIYESIEQGYLNKFN